MFLESYSLRGIFAPYPVFLYTPVEERPVKVHLENNIYTRIYTILYRMNSVRDRADSCVSAFFKLINDLFEFFFQARISL